MQWNFLGKWVIAIFATGQGSDELFGGYSSNCKSYDEYSKKLQRLLFDMCEEKTGLYDSRKIFLAKIIF